MSAGTTIKLSICIPTLNRGDLIGATLESIICQATDEVEIVIVDGGSTDATRQVVGDFQKRFQGIVYFRSDSSSESMSPIPSGSGFDRDCNRAVELSRGEYCWLFTDDDLFRPGAIESVLKAIRGQYGAVIVNAEARSSDLSHVLDPRTLRLTSDRLYAETDGQEFFINVANFLSFVGAVVINRSFWIERSKQEFLGTGLIHIGVLFQAPISHGAFVLAEPLVTIRYGNAHYMRSSRYFEIWMFIWPELIWSFAHFPDSAKRRVCRKEPWRRFRALLAFRAMGAYSMREYETWLATRLDSNWSKIVAKVTALVPGTAANLIIFTWNKLFRNPPEQVYVDLINSPFYFARIFTKGSYPSQTLDALEMTNAGRKSA